MGGARGPASKTLRKAAPRSRAAAAPRSPVDRRTVGRVLKLLRRAAKGWNAPVMALEAAENHDPFPTLIGCILRLRTRATTPAGAAPPFSAQRPPPPRPPT